MHLGPHSKHGSVEVLYRERAHDVTDNVVDIGRAGKEGLRHDYHRMRTRIAAAFRDSLGLSATRRGPIALELRSQSASIPNPTAAPRPPKISALDV